MYSFKGTNRLNILLVAKFYRYIEFKKYFIPLYVNISFKKCCNMELNCGCELEIFGKQNFTDVLKGVLAVLIGLTSTEECDRSVLGCS